MIKKILLLTLLIPSLSYAKWECINHNGWPATCNTWRWEVPHGWLVSTDNGDNDITMIFYPDENHDWKL